MSTSFTRGENPLRADKLNQAFSERVSRSGDTMQGMLTLWQDPTNYLDAATKHYVDATAHGITAPATLGLNVRDFGAKGDGIANDTAAIRTAVATLPVGGGAVYFPSGTYLVNSTIYVGSNTRLFGDGASSILKAIPQWVGIDPNGTNPNLAFIQNVNSAVPLSFPWTYTDHDIVIEKLAFDYTGLIQNNASNKCICMIRAQYVLIQDCVFNVAGSQNATAMLSTDYTVVNRCRAYEFRNCAYDHWYGPTRGVVVNNFARTSQSAQVINWNPDATGGSPTGLIADGFQLENNIFESTRATAIPMQLEVLGSGVGNSVRNMAIVGNIFRNVTLVTRGDTGSVQVTGNTFINPLGGSEAITAYSRADGIRPTAISCVGNVMLNPTTTGPSVGVIRIEGTDCIVSGNVVSGSGYAAPGIYTTGNAVVAGNMVSTGYLNINSPGTSISGSFIAPNGQSVAWYDNTNTIARWVLQTDNNHIFYGTNATGAQRGIFSIIQHSSTSQFFIQVPLQVNSTVGFNGTSPIAKPTVSGAKGANAALASLMTALAAYGLVTDSTTA